MQVFQDKQYKQIEIVNSPAYVSNNVNTSPILPKQIKFELERRVQHKYLKSVLVV